MIKEIEPLNVENFEISKSTRVAAPAGESTVRPEIAASKTKADSFATVDPIKPKRFDQTKVAEALSVENVERAIESVNSALKNANNSLRFQVDAAVTQPIISVVEKDTGKVLRQYPSEEVVRISKNIDSLRGVLFDSKG